MHHSTGEISEKSVADKSNHSDKKDMLSLLVNQIVIEHVTSVFKNNGAINQLKIQLVLVRAVDKVRSI